MVYLVNGIVISHSLFLGLGGLGVTQLKGKSSCKLKLYLYRKLQIMSCSYTIERSTTILFQKFTKHKCNKTENYFTKTLGRTDGLLVKFAELVL